MATESDGHDPVADRARCLSPSVWVRLLPRDRKRRRGGGFVREGVDMRLGRREVCEWCPGEGVLRISMSVG